MALQRHGPLCLLCQCRQGSIGRRRAASAGRRLLNTKPTDQPQGGQSFSDSAYNDHRAGEDEVVGHSSPESANTSSDVIADLSFEALGKFKEVRQRILATLRNPWPSLSDLYPQNGRLNTKAKFPNRVATLFADLELPEANAALIPHATFRKMILHSDLQRKEISRVLRTQLLRAQHPRDIYRILAVSFQAKESTLCISVLFEPIIRALYRSRTNVSDPEVLKTLNVIIRRFELAGLPVPESFVSLGLRFAARTRRLEAMKEYLRRVRQMGTGITANVFRSTIAKFSIGHRGLGEIRNGRWRRSDLLQVLKGFDDCVHLPEREKYHLGSFLVRSDWQFLHGWVAALARCRDADAVWEEWELWKRSPARTRPRLLYGIGKAMTTKRRGDFWFVEQMAMAGDIERAWKVLDESHLNFRNITGQVEMMLLERPELASQRLWESGVRERLVVKYDYELTKIEKAYGIVWRPPEGDEEADGMHELMQDQLTTLEKLGADNWQIEETYGFPYGNEDEANMVVPGREDRALHDAEERGLAGKEYNDT